MIDYTTKTFTTTKNSYDEGLRSYLLKVYNYMALALALTGISALATLSFKPLAVLMFQTSFGTLISFAPLAIAFYFSLKLNKMTVVSARMLFCAFSVLMGMSLAYLGLIYTGESIIRAVFICASLFGAMSLYGYSTNKDLTSMGSFLIMGLIGLVFTSLINLLLQSPAIYFAVSLIGIAIFMGLIAYDTQKIKSMYFVAGGGELGQKMSIIAALHLYLDFINLLQYSLRFLGNRKN